MRITLSDDQRLDWLRLIRTDSIGPRTFRALINRFGSASAALEALPDVSRKAGKPVVPFATGDAEQEMRGIRRLGARLIALGEAGYPAGLQAVDTAPPLLAVSGNAEALMRPAVGIVGSRNASALGLKFTSQLAHALAEAGFLVVSGLARGIDTAAHEASLVRGTVAALAGGLDRVYPAQNQGLHDRLIETGAAISEMPLGWEPRSRDFPRRNRLISGLSLGVVVVEAARGSGSLITARFALEQGREVFAVPGSPLDPRASGTNDLIRQGATLVSEPAHVIDALQPQFDFDGPPIGARDGGADERDMALWDELPLPELGLVPLQTGAVPSASRAGAMPYNERGLIMEEAASAPLLRARMLDLLGPTPIAIDDLIRLTGSAARDAQLALLDLELDGLVQRHAGQRISLVA